MKTLVIMSLLTGNHDYTIGIIIAVLLLIYLVYSLIKPEKF